MKIVLATHNRDKIKEFKNKLSLADIILLSLDDFPDLPETIEDGVTLEQNSLKKAKEIFEFTGLPSIADDTGLLVEVLNGEPGVYSARYAGENATYRDNCEKLLLALKDTTNRASKFSTVITFYYADNKYVQVKGELEGNIAYSFTGENGFGYDPIFYVTELSKSLGELTLEQKNRISHRAKAIEAIIPHLLKFSKLT
ncbi:MAG: RdgB/HAM1 family non-canonical purine NTP pyrophosphatase [Candidatus Delongbacteria bacterium]|nr:RdgB/HAM1 family non-canonical purine NTP pyrophosphatase [Candidatus Delongbacteria bacterium]MBN2836299.1 RdgB/HAM1 family non-canonical purine NTP pyrophosphatase [Candidatus Delongbacteria bacterium]